MRSLAAIREHKETLTERLGNVLEEEKQAEAREAADNAPVAQGRAFCHPAHAMLFEALRREEQEEAFPPTRAKCKLPAEVLPQADAERKGAPMYRGLLGYFPLALFRVAQHSMISDRKHNPDTPEEEAPHWNRGTSQDHLDCIPRHLCELHRDPDYHLRAIAWRALAALQEHEERKGAAPGASSVFR